MLKIYSYPLNPYPSLPHLHLLPPFLKPYPPTSTCLLFYEEKASTDHPGRNTQKTSSHQHLVNLTEVSDSLCLILQKQTRQKYPATYLLLCEVDVSDSSQGIIQEQTHLVLDVTKVCGLSILTKHRRIKIITMLHQETDASCAWCNQGLWHYDPNQTQENKLECFIQEQTHLALDITKVCGLCILTRHRRIKLQCFIQEKIHLVLDITKVCGLSILTRHRRIKLEC